MKTACGTRQVLKAIKSGKAVKVYIADDSDAFLKQKILETAKQYNIPVEKEETMRILGKKCGIAVGSATAADICD